MKRCRTPHGKENAIQKPGHPDTKTARDDPVFLMGGGGYGENCRRNRSCVGRQTPPKIVRESGNVMYSRNRPWWGMEPYMISASPRQIDGKCESQVGAVPVPPASANSYHYIICTIYPRNLSPQKPNQGSAIHPVPPIQEQTPMGKPPDLHKRNPYPLFIKVLPGFFKSRVPPVPLVPRPPVLRVKEDRAARRACWFRRGSRRRGRG